MNLQKKALKRLNQIHEDRLKQNYQSGFEKGFGMGITAGRIQGFMYTGYAALVVIGGILYYFLKH